MLTALHFCAKDRHLAFGLLQWIQELGGAKNHELLLVTGVHTASMGMHAELELLAHEVFGKAEFRITDTQDEGGWPSSANNAWRDTIIFSRMKIGKPFLWLEPDCTPLTSDWLDRIDAEYNAAGKPFLGAEVTVPQHRMSGIGIYPPDFVRYTSRLHMLQRNVPFDQYFAQDIVPNANFTPLIQNVWNVEFGKPETIPTFPDQESLKLLDPKAVLFHRCKDLSLIQRLREKRPANAVPVEIEDQDDPLVVQNEMLSKQNEELMKRLAAMERSKSEMDYCAMVSGISRSIETSPNKPVFVSAIDERQKEISAMMEEKHRKELESGVPYTPEQEQDLLRRMREVLDRKMEPISGSSDDGPMMPKANDGPSVKPENKRHVPMKQKRKMSPEAREKISEAQRKRWEKKRLTGVV